MRRIAGRASFRALAALWIIGAVAGCAAQAPSPEEQKIWGRIDCQRAASSPAIAMEMERVKTVCVGRAEAAAIAGTTAIPTGYGIGGAIASGIQRGTAQGQIANATITSCMAEHGMMLRTLAEHNAICADVEAQKQQQARRR